MPGRRATRLHILVYTALLVPVAIGAGFTAIGGPLYVLTATLASLWFLRGAVAIWRRDEVAAAADGYLVEKRVFRFSLYYLFLLFATLLLEAALRGAGIGGW